MVAMTTPRGPGHLRRGGVGANTADVLALCVLSVLLVAVSIRQEWPLLTLRDASRDFTLLFISADRARTGQPLYASADRSDPGPLLNFNPPHLHALLVPLTVLPLRTAYLVWGAANVVLLAVVLTLALRETQRRVETRTRILVVAVALGSVGVVSTLRMGQISMWVALLATLAWSSARHNRHWAAAVWLGLAASVKPFLLLGIPVLVVRRQPLAALITAIVSVAAIASGALWLGTDAVRDWLHVFGTDRLATRFPLNAALAGVFTRAGLPGPVALLAAVVLAVLTLWRVRTADDDLAWALWFTAALLCSPLGWVYYLPMLFGPMIALISARRLPASTGWLAAAFLPVPLSTASMQSPAVVAATLGSVYCWALLALWVVLFRAHDRIAEGVPSPAEEGPLKSPRVAPS
jgi:glycosyl transferase family 87